MDDEDLVGVSGERFGALPPTGRDQRLRLLSGGYVTAKHVVLGGWLLSVASEGWAE
ncbi:hypothetical protein ABZV58_05865 [Nocardia sp. NPDC004654]|uniref:hypothetical protein n=1 Tax=Nocardia sp. NPDC004654 TaxID=3154776 RepID=UPI0033A25408